MALYQDIYTEIGTDMLNNYYYLRMQDKENSREPAVMQVMLRRMSKP